MSLGDGGSEHERPWPGQSAADLPVEIAFLARHGFLPSTLTEVARRAARLGTEPAREIIASGIVDEITFYRAVADELGLTFHQGVLPLRPGGDHAAILRESMAPLSDAADPNLRFVVAPQGRVLRRMLEAGLRNRRGVAIITPSAFAESLRTANASGVARRLAGEDEEGLARDSARHRLSRGQRVVLALGSVAAALAGLAAPLQSFFALAMLVGPLFLMLILLRIGSALEGRDAALQRSQRWRPDDSRLPLYTVAVPLFREERVLRQLVAALAALDYPRAKLDIKLLVEADDSGMRAALDRLALQAPFSVCIVPPGQPRTKPRALNLALAEARGSLFTIFDAEDIPEPQQLRLAAARFMRAPAELACLQARLVIDDQPGGGLLPRLFALEYAALFEVINPGLLREQLPILLGGTSNHFRTEALRAVGGWDAWNVTEDADLGVRLARAGYRMGDLPSETREEAPLTARAWLKQRSRWLKGYIQTIATHSRRPLALLREAGIVPTLALTALTLGTVLAALGYPVFAVAAYLAFLDGSLFAPEEALTGIVSTLAVTIWLMGHVALLLPPVIGALRQRRPLLLLLLPLLPLYYALVSVAAWIALYEFLARPHAWNKTAHGLAQRRAPSAPRSSDGIRYSVR